MPLTSSLRPAVGLLALALAACARGNALEGSLSEVVSLKFHDVEVARTDTDLSISYFTWVGDATLGARDTVFKLDVYLSSVIPDAPFDLSPDLDGNRRAEATRAVAEDPIRRYAPLHNGAITFDREVQVGYPTSGTFHVFFAEGGDAGKGRTAYGNFDVPVVVPAN
jgi:hypothetical protein